MDFTLSFAGLGLLVLAWGVQVAFSLKGSKNMRPCFAGLQFVGITLLVVDTFMSTGQITSLAWLNIATAVGALVTLVLVLRK